ncbi:hypothetical protein ACQU0X_28840 [Pseudovibrio ascidiaceicola]|uniref:hypothetical protein n=1 Tax=Pseudovibrio ascidiaceicola TaxID=285279 RepID=UPI003D36BAC8
MEEQKIPESVVNLCAEVGIKPRLGSEPKGSFADAPTETYAIQTIDGLLKRHGREHVWQVLFAASTVNPPPKLLQASLIAALSDLLLTYPEWSKRLGTFTDALERLDLDELQDTAKRFPRCGGPTAERSSARSGLAAVIYWALLPLMEEEMQYWLPNL